MSPEGQAALQRSIREVMEDTTSPVETLSRTGADTTYAVRKELQSRREKTPEGSPGVSPKLRAATEPFHQRESEVAALMGPQGFRRHHMMEKAEAPRDFVYATFLEHMEVRSGTGWGVAGRVRVCEGSVVKLTKKFFFSVSVSKLSKKTICYSVSGVSTQLRN